MAVMTAYIFRQQSELCGTLLTDLGKKAFEIIGVFWDTKKKLCQKNIEDGFERLISLIIITSFYANFSQFFMLTFFFNFLIFVF